MPRKITAYACKFNCGQRVVTNKNSMKLHETRCFANPETKSCKTCSHLKRDSQTYYNPYHGGNPGSTDYEIPYLYCELDEEDSKKFKLKTNCKNYKITH